MGLVVAATATSAALSTHAEKKSSSPVTFSLAVAEAGGGLEDRKLDPKGGKVRLVKSPWKCAYAAREIDTDGDSMIRESLRLKCSLGAAVVELGVACRYVNGPGRSKAEVHRDAQGMTLSTPTGKQRAYVSMSCSVKR